MGYNDEHQGLMGEKWTSDDCSCSTNLFAIIRPCTLSTSCPAACSAVSGGDLSLMMLLLHVYVG